MNTGEGVDPAVMDAELDVFFVEQFAPLVGYLRSAEKVPEQVALRAAHHAMQVVRRKWPTLRSEKPKPYLYRAAIRWARKNLPKHQSTSVGLDLERPDTSELTVDGVISRAYVDALLDALPPRQRQVAFLLYVHGFSVEQTASILGVTDGTVKKSGSLARARLRELIEKEDRK